MVVFDTKSKRFRETNDFEKARQIFTSAPEGWYAVLKNPAADNMHPEAAKAMLSPELEIGHKINIAGPANFALFPGQMARVIRGHRLRSNQYLIARVYDAAAIVNSEAIIVDNEGNSVKNETTYHAGQLLIIKGTEVSFYVPPTGIEVVPTANGEYVREAVTLERLEYAILKDEDGEFTYRETKRGAKGVSTLKATEKVGNLIAVRAVNLEDDLMAITNAGIVIRTPLAQIRIASRNTQGVKIMNLEGRQKVSSIAIVPHEEPLPEDEEISEDVNEEETSTVVDGSEVKDTSLE